MSQEYIPIRIEIVVYKDDPERGNDVSAKIDQGGTSLFVASGFHTKEAAIHAAAMHMAETLGLRRKSSTDIRKE